MHKKGGTKLGTLYDRIQDLCKGKGVSGSRMCLDLGLSKSTLSDIHLCISRRTYGRFCNVVDSLFVYMDRTLGSDYVIAV